MNIGIIDADLISNGNHRFPNLVCMKISTYYKLAGSNSVDLLLDWNDIDQYDKVYISKVFDYSVVPINLDTYDNVVYGGTGFFYDKAPPLPEEIEHSKPDYDLYLPWVSDMISKGRKRKEFEYYLDHSIGYLTRKCFRGCYYCVNKNYKKVEVGSPLKEFLDESKKYICLLDDNFLGYKNWNPLLEELQNTGKRFQFKQGLDERLLNEKNVKMLTDSKYYGDYIFAFDNIEDKKIIIKKLQLWKKYCNKTTKFYVFCACDKEDKYNNEFWKQDIINTFERVKILMEYKCLPYIMRFKEYNNSPYYGTYVNIARWCNQPSQFKKKSYREWVMSVVKTDGIKCKAYQYMIELEEKHPDIAAKYFDMKY